MTTAIPENMDTIFKHITERSRTYIDRLTQAVRIKSVSSDTNDRDKVIAMVKWTQDKLNKLGATTELCDVGFQTLSDGRSLRLPPVILGTLGSDEKKPTVCVYGHLDVQPAAKEDGWNTDPFDLVEKDGKLFGRGASDDKGPVLCWINAIEAYQQCAVDLPVNVKFVLEGMEESGSEGLPELLEERKHFFKDVDYVCISDNYWLGTTKPCITYGLRGICYFFIEIECAQKDLHSGLYGGCLNEATTDLVHVLNSLLDKDGTIQVPHIHDDVLPVTDEEKKLYKDIQFNIFDFKNEIGTKNLLHNEDKVKVLMSRWRFPSLSIHGIEGAFSDEGSKTVIPKKVIGKFSIRIVPDQDPLKIEKCVVKHLNNVWKTRGSSNRFKAYMTHGAKAWLSDVDSPNYAAAKSAIKMVYGVEPDFTREGGSIPITLNLQEITGKSVILIPIGACDDSAHSQNEKIDIRNYIEGTKVLASYLNEIATLHPSNK